MRKIKFVAYIKFSQEVHEVLELRSNGDVMTSGYDYCLDKDDINLMQYTGFQDRKGNDIYEGHIIYVAGFGNAVVEICHANGAEFHDLNCNYRPMVNADAEGDIGEILGNIYGNPDLIKH